MADGLLKNIVNTFQANETALFRGKRSTEHLRRQRDKGSNIYICVSCTQIQCLCPGVGRSKRDTKTHANHNSIQFSIPTWCDSQFNLLTFAVHEKDHRFIFIGIHNLPQFVVVVYWLTIATDQDIPILEPSLSSGAIGCYRRNEHAIRVRHTDLTKNDAINKHGRKQVHQRTCKHHCEPCPWTGRRQTTRNRRIVLTFRADESPKREPVEREARAPPCEQGQRAGSGQANAKFLDFNLA